MKDIHVIDVTNSLFHVNLNQIHRQMSNCDDIKTTFLPHLHPYLYHQIHHLIDQRGLPH
jgi:hypothetical protein